MPIADPRSFQTIVNSTIYKDNPTNSEFISIIAEKLRLQMFEMQSVA